MAPGDPAGRNVVDIRFGPELWIEGKCYLGNVKKVVHRTIGDGILRKLDPALEPYLAYAGGDASCHIALFYPGVAGYAFLADSGGGVVHGLLVGTVLNALPVASATRLVDENDSVFRTFVDGLSGTGCQTGGVGAVVADSLEVEEECPMPWLGEG